MLLKLVSAVVLVFEDNSLSQILVLIPAASSLRSRLISGYAAIEFPQVFTEVLFQAKDLLSQQLRSLHLHFICIASRSLTAAAIKKTFAQNLNTEKKYENENANLLQET